MLSKFSIVRAAKIADFDGSIPGYPVLDVGSRVITNVPDLATADRYIELGKMMRLLISINALSLPVDIRHVDLEEIIHLRHRILRPDLPVDTAIFEGDEAHRTKHIGLFQNESVDDSQGVLSCATFVRKAWREQSAHQLRGMATDASYQGCGLGSALLSKAEEMIIRETGIKIFWCNARLKAVNFYRRAGWKDDSPDFEIPTAGPHRIMVKNCH